MNKLIYISVAVLVLCGCSIRKQLGTDLERRSAGDLTECLNNAQVNPEWFSTKISTDLEYLGETNSFTASVRIRKDSVIWMNIKKGPFQLASVLITPDSIHILKKIDQKQYIRSDFNYLKRTFNIDLDFTMLQNLFFGNPIGFDPDDKYKKLDDPNYYVLSTHSQRQIERAYDKLPRKEEKQYIQRYWIQPENCKIHKTMITHLADTSELQIINHNYRKEHDFLFPNKVSLVGLSTIDSVALDLNFSRYKVNKKLSFPFKPNDKYEISNGEDEDSVE